ncbi:MAG: hypothetical protein IJJ57_07675 [Ruminococcus sp.]|nr:hypothetical protein [Ruminococcus sp.]
MKCNLGIAIILFAIFLSFNSSGKEGITFLLAVIGLIVSVAENVYAIVNKCKKQEK